MNYRIQEVSKKLKVPRSTIRFWETEFSELVRPTRTNGGQRRYSEADVESFRQIKKILYHRNRSIQQARRLLKLGNEDIDKIDWAKQTILVTGGTGSFGRHFCKIMVEKYHPQVIRIYSRDEIKQGEMRREFKQGCARYFIGDVRDYDRLRRAMEGVDIVVHTANLSQLRSCEYNPLEAVKTNIHGAQNIIDAAIDTGVKKVVALSSDMAVYPVNLYGATALCAEKMFVQGNVYSGTRATRFSCFRCGNVIDGRGGLVSLFREQKEKGLISSIDERMTRFWITMDQAVNFVIKGLEVMDGGEIFVPKTPSVRIIDIAKAITQECMIEFPDDKPGVKIHQVMISEEDGPNTIQYDGTYIILPEQRFRAGRTDLNAKPVPKGFKYASNINNEWLSFEELKQRIPHIDPRI
jgi:UDP-N-acetylglucosamine 4,6-dehydratase